jgi:hypothetical protein
MRSAGTAEYDYQLMNLIRALVGRTAIYRAGVLLLYSTLYCLIFTGYVTALVLTRSERAGQAVANIAKTLPDVSYDVHFAPGDTCDTSPDAMREIESIVAEVENRRPRGLLVIGSTDAMPMSRALARTVGDARELSMSRAECVSMRITQLLRLKGESIPIEVTTRGAQDKSAQARILGNTADAWRKCGSFDQAP